MQEFRAFSIRLQEFLALKAYKLIADETDYIIFEDKNGQRFQCSGESVHLAMLKENII